MKLIGFLFLLLSVLFFFIPSSNPGSGMMLGIYGLVCFIPALFIFIYLEFLKPIYIKVHKQHIILSKIMIILGAFVILFFSYLYLITFFLNLLEVLPSIGIMFACFELYILYILIYYVYNLICDIYGKIKK